MLINSLLETDFYKFSKEQAKSHQSNNDTTTWAFMCRKGESKPSNEIVALMKKTFG